MLPRLLNMLFCSVSPKGLISPKGETQYMKK
ncbi:MAG: hypothetical protein BWZ10_02800 [candidate division BRC1 bacterium ADurb.BinA364]|nr:MAG: hypothetical protein BWZ10_02800 [candidate division BRC1 bacterium ADurb.BinA364]